MEHFYQNIGEDWFDYPDVYSYIVNKFDSGSHFVEVGAWKGRSAAFMAVELINSNKSIKFDCVDTWEGSPDVESHVNDPAVKENKLYELFLENIKPVKNIINPLRMTSVEASKLYQDKSLQFVFIDANHDYEHVKEDIIHWLPKVAPGGIIAGHDRSFPGVSQALRELLPNAGEISRSCWMLHID